MCGRYLLAPSVEHWDELKIPWWNELPQLFNIAPTENAPVILIENGQQVAKEFRWGLIPAWANEAPANTFNARSETVDEKPSFRESFARRRCLVLATGWYEWIGKRPHRIHRSDGKPLTFAGIWDSCRLEGRVVHSYSILTADIADSLSSLHDRQPIIVEPEDRERWLDRSIETRESLEDIMTGRREHGVVFEEVSERVNSVANKGADVLRLGPDQQSLF